MPKLLFLSAFVTIFSISGLFAQVHVSGNINKDTTWTSGNGVIIIDSSITISSNIALHIQAGTIIKVVNHSPINVKGVLDLQGTSGNPVIFTSIKDDSYGGDTNGDKDATVPSEKDWGMIQIFNSNNVIDYCKIRYGGVFNNAGINIINCSPIVDNCTIEYCGENGICVEGGYNNDSITHPTLSNNTISHCTYPIEMEGYSVPTIIGNTITNVNYYGIALVGYIGSSEMRTDTLPKIDGLPYLLRSYLNIRDNLTLVIPAGTIFKGGLGGSLRVDGVLDLQGTSSNPVIFTSIKDDSYGGDTNGDKDATVPSYRDWNGITISNNNTTIHHCKVRYAGFSFSPGIFIEQCSPTIDNCEIEYCVNGIHVYGGPYPYNESRPTLSDNIISHCTYPIVQENYSFPIISGNTISNVSYNGIAIKGNMIPPSSRSEALPKIDGLPYILNETLTIGSEMTLVIPAGTIFKGTEPYSFLIVSGVLDLQGTASNPVIFTSINDDSYGEDTNGDKLATVPAAGDWGSIVVNNTNNTIKNCKILYGGGSENGGIKISGCSPVVDSCEIQYCGEEGIQVYSGTDQVSAARPTIRNNTISNCAYPIALENYSFPILIDNTISNVSYNGIAIQGNMNPSIPRNETLPKISRFPYVLNGALTIGSKMTLGIPEGTIFKGTAWNAVITVNGVLDAQRTSSDPVIFTSIKDDSYGGDTNGDKDATIPSYNNWGGIVIKNANDKMYYCKVRYCFTGIWIYGCSPSMENCEIDNCYRGIYILSEYDGVSVARPTLRNNIISNCTYPVALENYSFPILTGNTISSVVYNGIAIQGNMNPSASRHETLPKITGLPYLLSGNLTIGSKLILVIPAGTIFKGIDNHASMTLNGTLDIQATASDPVIFTSIKDDSYGGDTNGDNDATVPSAGDWGSIIIYNTNNSMDYCKVRYGGSSYYGAITINGCSPRFNNCEIAWNYLGFRVDGFGSSNPEPFISNCNIGNNSSYNILTGNFANTSETIFYVYAKNNWWGTTIESEIKSKINDYSNNSRGGKVIYSPYLSAVNTAISNKADFDLSGRVDGVDLAILAAAFGSSTGETRYNSNADLDVSGRIDGYDLAIFAIKFSKASFKPAAQDIFAANSDAIIVEGPNSYIERDDEFTINFCANNLSDIYAIALDLKYNPDALELLKTEEGDFLKSKDENTIFLKSPREKGCEIVGLSKHGEFKSGESGSGKIFQLTFKVISETGKSEQIEFSNVGNFDIFL